MANEYPPLVSLKSLAKGFAGASLAVCSIANPYGIIIQTMLLIAGLVMLVDGIMVSVKGVFIVICLLAAIFGGVFSLVFSVTAMGIPYLAVIIIISFLLYFWPFLKSGGKLARRNEAQENPEKP